MTVNQKARVSAAALTIIAFASVATQAYVSYGKWQTKSVVYYINPTNLDVTADAAEAATQSAASGWSAQSAADFAFVYGGRVNDTTTGYDGQNVVIFRNASNGGALASTYYWSSGTTVTDADIIVWDGAFTFYTGSGTCSGGGAYLEDVLTHEFGHALGLKHSAAPDATMYPSYSYCSQEMRSLASDDIAGVEALYPPSGQSSQNTAPTVTITAPSGGSSSTQGTNFNFSGSASDTQDGNLSAALSWSSSINGPIGDGAGFSRSDLSVGTHVITAQVVDSANASGSSSVTITVTAPPSNGPALTVRAYKLKGLQKADLAWSGFATVATVDEYRNGSLVKTTGNDGADTDAIDKKGGGSYTYQVCEPGAKTVCSNVVTVSF